MKQIIGRTNGSDVRHVTHCLLYTGFTALRLCAYEKRIGAILSAAHFGRLERIFRYCFLRSLRVIFINEKLFFLSFQRLMHYCAQDVRATIEVHRSLWPKFRKKCVHIVLFLMHDQ